MLKMDGGTWWSDSWEEQKVLGPRNRLYDSIITKAAPGFDQQKQGRRLLPELTPNLVQQQEGDPAKFLCCGACGAMSLSLLPARAGVD